MAPVPTQVTNLLRELTEQLPSFVGQNLVGIYLYGSLTHAAFDLVIKCYGRTWATSSDLLSARTLPQVLRRESLSGVRESRLVTPLLDNVMPARAVALTVLYGRGT